MGLQPMWRGEPSAPGEGRAERSPLQSALSPSSCRDSPGKSPPICAVSSLLSVSGHTHSLRSGTTHSTPTTPSVVE